MQTEEPTIKNLVHKADDKNVVITDLRQESGFLDNGFRYDYISDLVVDTSHNFFFEHERRHIPGLLLIEAVRQNAIAITHKFLCVPLTMSFILNEFNNTFPNFAQLGYPARIYTHILKQELKSDRIASYVMEVRAVQNGLDIIRTKGSFSITTDDVVKRLENIALRKTAWVR